MSDHQLIWEYDSGHVEAQVICTAADDADCKLAPTDPGCVCEEWVIERDEKGAFHTVTEYDDSGTHEVETRHAMAPSDECNATNYLDGSDLLEMGWGRFEIARTPIDLAWEGSGYDWTRADEPTGTVTIPRPHVPFGPKSISEDEADQKYLLGAADDLEKFYKPFGNNLRQTVVKVLRDCATAIGGKADG